MFASKITVILSSLEIDKSKIGIENISGYFIRKLAQYFINGVFMKIYLLIRQAVRERERFSIHCLSPSGCNDQICPRPKLGAQNSILVSHVDGRHSSTKTIFPCLPRHIRGSGSRRAARIQTCDQTWVISHTSFSCTH